MSSQGDQCLHPPPRSITFNNYKTALLCTVTWRQREAFTSFFTSAKTHIPQCWTWQCAGLAVRRRGHSWWWRLLDAARCRRAGNSYTTMNPSSNPLWPGLLIWNTSALSYFESAQASKNTRRALSILTLAQSLPWECGTSLFTPCSEHCARLPCHFPASARQSDYLQATNWANYYWSVNKWLLIKTHFFSPWAFSFSDCAFALSL